MSSIASALNSLAAVTLDDLFDRPPVEQGVWLSLGISLAWGVFAVLPGLAFPQSDSTVLELINHVGSAFNGPVLAVFALGFFVHGLSGRAVIDGFAGGRACNLLAAQLTTLSWLLWNPLGFVTTAGLALVGSRANSLGGNRCLAENGIGAARGTVSFDAHGPWLYDDVCAALSRSPVPLGPCLLDFAREFLRGAAAGIIITA